MYVVMLASECAPIAKVGGLADVVGGLAAELAKGDVDVDIVLPRYRRGREDLLRNARLLAENIEVPYHDRKIPCRVIEAAIAGAPSRLRVLLVEPQSEHAFFDRDEVYGYPDDLLRFAFFTRAAMEVLVALGRKPDVLHCHDWMTGLGPVLLFEHFERHGLPRTRACFTLHNLQHQGVGGVELLRAVGLSPERLMTGDRLAHTDGRRVNQLKGGIVYANAVTTVSKTYAREIRDTELGCGLQTTLKAHSAKLFGVLNGIDWEVWNPSTDPKLAAHFSARELQPKYDNKRALRERLGLADVFKPIVAVVSRLDRQKGVHLIRHAIFASLRYGAQFVLLGSAPDKAIGDDFAALRDKLAENHDVKLVFRFDDELAHLIYAGSEFILVPSLFEPCGLTQMIGLRYGTVPIVRETGGLAETVFDANWSGRPPGEVNGFSFKHTDAAAVDSALSRAIGLWHQHPDFFRRLQLNGMKCDNSWRLPAEEYEHLYSRIRAPGDATVPSRPATVPPPSAVDTVEATGVALPLGPAVVEPAPLPVPPATDPTPTMPSAIPVSPRSRA